jgi:quercetin dioxygenase-like cupin family protein
MIVVNKEAKTTKLDEKSTRKILGCDGSLMMVEVSFKKGGVGKPHSHTDHEQISYIVKGSFKVTIGEEERILHQGDSFYAAKNVKHGVVALEDAVILDVFTPIRQDFL